MTVATAAAFHLPWLGAAALVLAGLGAEMIDGHDFAPHVAQRRWFHHMLDEHR